MTPRDPHLDSAGFALALSHQQERVEQQQRVLTEDGGLGRVARRTLARDLVTLGMTHYAAGSDVAVVRGFFDEAVDVRTFVAEQSGPVDEQEDWSPHDELTKVFAAAVLVGRLDGLAGKCLSASAAEGLYRRGTGKGAPLALLLQLVQLSRGEPIDSIEVRESSLRSHGAGGWIPVIASFAGLAAADQQRFSQGLARYLDKEWKRFVSAFQKNPPEKYLGCFDVFAGAQCFLAGYVPALPPKLARYVPAELV